jgi:hypothetical protein
MSAPASAAPGIGAGAANRGLPDLGGDSLLTIRRASSTWNDMRAGWPPRSKDVNVRSWFSKADKQEETPQERRCRMGVHERTAIIVEGRDLYSTCGGCGRKLVRVGADWRVALPPLDADQSVCSRRAHI